MVWAPPWPPAAPLLPGEVDTVRLLHVTLHVSHAFAAAVEQPDASAMKTAGGEVAGVGGTPAAAASTLLQVGMLLHLSCFTFGQYSQCIRVRSTAEPRLECTRW